MTSLFMNFLAKEITIEYGSIFLDFLRAARYTLRITHFIRRAFELYSRMVPQEGNKDKISRKSRKYLSETQEF